MTMWSDATASRERERVPLKCPHCGAVDIPGTKPTIEIEGRLAVCSVCSWGWLISYGERYGKC